MKKAVSVKTIKNMNEFVKEVCKREGGKTQVNIAQVKQIVKIMVELLLTDPIAYQTMEVYADKMATKLKKAKKKC